MPLPPTSKPYAFKDKVELAIDSFAARDEPSSRDLAEVRVVAQVEQQLDTYRAQAKHMSVDELEDESHQSAVLGALLAETGDPRPHPQCHAHAIVSGAHKDAAELRAVLAWRKVRIDDPDNGCWLPKNTAAKAQMPVGLRHAVPHSRIHRFNYYFWLNSLINPVTTGSEDKVRASLRMIGIRLQKGTQPPFVMKRKGDGLPG